MSFFVYESEQASKTGGHESLVHRPSHYHPPLFWNNTSLWDDTPLWGNNRQTKTLKLFFYKNSVFLSGGMLGIANHSLSFMITISLLIWLAYANTDEKSSTELPARILLGQGILFLFLFIMIIWKPWKFDKWFYSFFFLFAAAVVAEIVLALVYFSYTFNENSSKILISNYECSNATFCSVGVMMSYINLIQAIVIIIFCLVFLLIEKENLEFEMLKALKREWGPFWEGDEAAEPSPFYKNVSEMLDMFLIIQLSVSILGIGFASSEDLKSLPAELMFANVILILFTIFVLNYMRFAGNDFNLKDCSTWVWVVSVLSTWVVSLVYVSVTWTSSMDEALPGDYACNNLTYCSAAVVMKVLNFLWIFVGFFSLILLVFLYFRGHARVSVQEEGEQVEGEEGGTKPVFPMKIKVFP